MICAGDKVSDRPGYRVVGWLLAEAWRQGKAHNHSQRAASLAYYIALAAAPLLLVLLVVITNFYRDDASSERLRAYLAQTAGDTVAAVVQEILSHAAAPQIAGLAGLFGILVIFWGASNVFAELQSSLRS
ncbi:MAG: YhjD/YihY/BrkB family envelope integrity protein [Verrucomicrobiales bacterium]